jgi:hypothetical protein
MTARRVIFTFLRLCICSGSVRLPINVPITLETDGTFMFYGHGEKVAQWMCGDEEDDLAFYNIRREPNPTTGYLVTGKT